MSDTVRVTNMPESGSAERVAYDLWYVLRGHVGDAVKGKAKVKVHLDLYAACLSTVRSAQTPDLANIP
jgi:hypothetical protein